jgi:hypothetical protein
MSRTGLFVLVGLMTACAAFAVPAPPRTWVDGWKAVDPDGDYKFVRKRDVLTIEVPGNDDALCIGLSSQRMYDNGSSPSVRNCPRLVQTVTGDFIVQVRVSGDFHPQAETKPCNARVSAGLVLLSDVGKCAWEALEKVETNDAWFRFPFLMIISPEGIGISDSQGTEIYLRLERAANEVRLSHSKDGRTWKKTEVWKEAALPAKVKIGVFAASTSTRPFKPHFDKFKLTQKSK